MVLFSPSSRRRANKSDRKKENTGTVRAIDWDGTVDGIETREFEKERRTNAKRPLDPFPRVVEWKQGR